MAQRGKPAYTEKLAEEVIQGIAVGLFDKDAALSAGISPDTFARWMKGQSQAPASFAERVERARPRRVKRWLTLLYQQAEAGDVKAIAELLDRCAKDYRKTATLEHSGPGGGPIEHKHTHRDLGLFTDDEVTSLAAVAEQIKRGERVP